jgi:hypothetical protein
MTYKTRGIAKWSRLPDRTRPPDPPAVRVQNLLATIEREKAKKNRKKLLKVLRTGLIVLRARERGL